MHKHNEEYVIDCAICKNKIPFELPDEVFNACKVGKLIIFAGAGISTEAINVFPFTLYEDIKRELNVGKDKKISFPALMTQYCKASHGRKELLNKINDRIDYIKSFPELYRQATEFHRELSTIHQIREIITTNWDSFFEEECGTTPFVAPEDFAFWDYPGRKVFKIHGSINNLGSIIATEEDYKKCYKDLQKGLIGSNLKLLLATKTVIFVGYSFGDDDFNKIYQYLQKEMKGILPHSYIVTLSDEKDIKFKKLNSTIIKTDATYFISVLKRRLVEKQQMLDDKEYDTILNGLSKIENAHFKLSNLDIKRKPEAIFCGSYQDGVIHSFERMLQKRNTGEYSHLCNIESKIDSYFRLRKVFLKRKKYFDVAYIDGYLTGLYCFIPELRKKMGLPLYYVFGSKSDIFNYKDYLRVSKKAKSLHKSSYKWAEKKARNYKKGIVLHHTAFLL